MGIFKKRYIFCFTLGDGFLGVVFIKEKINLYIYCEYFIECMIIFKIKKKNYVDSLV